MNDDRFLLNAQSGTTGQPKGVMLSHDNLTWVSHALATYMDVRDGKEVFLSYLPLSHVAAQVTNQNNSENGAQ